MGALDERLLQTAPRGPLDPRDLDRARRQVLPVCLVLSPHAELGVRRGQIVGTEAAACSIVVPGIADAALPCAAYSDAGLVPGSGLDEAP